MYLDNNFSSFVRHAQQPTIIQPKVQSDGKYSLLNRYYEGERHHKGFPDLVTLSLELNGGGNGYCMGES